jgi:hypothetical protein
MVLVDALGRKQHDPQFYVDAIIDWRRTHSGPLLNGTIHVYKGEKLNIGNFRHRVRDGRVRLTHQQEKVLADADVSTQKTLRISQDQYQRALDEWCEQNKDHPFDSKAIIEIDGHCVNLYNRSKAIHAKRRKINVSEEERQRWDHTLLAHRMGIVRLLRGTNSLKSKPSPHSTQPDTDRSLARAMP